ncbi:MAG: hypothetical protein KJ638_08590 [Chloroflexi bacterium]|nr:hypothetical protein [Chloroflexota bacterium]
MDSSIAFKTLRDSESLRVFPSSPIPVPPTPIPRHPNQGCPAILADVDGTIIGAWSLSKEKRIELAATIAHRADEIAQVV